MKRDNRQILVNPHSSQEKVPVGVLNLGEIGVQHNNVEDAALYVETVADSESASTIAKFITEKAIETKIENALDIVQMEIDSLNEEIGLPHDPEQWDSGLSVWEAIELTYEEMTAGIAAAETKLFIDEAEGHNEKYLKLRSVKDEETSAVSYYVKTEGIDEAIDEVVNKVEELSAATKDVLDGLDFTGVTKEGKPIVNVTQENGLISAETGRINTEFIDYDSANTLDEVIENIIENIEANKVESEDGSIVVTPGVNGTYLKVNRDNATIVLNDNNELVADLKLSTITPSNANVREEFALLDHNGRQLGDTVKVYKDSSLYKAFLGHVDDVLTDSKDPESLVSGSGDTALDLIYHKEDGTYELVAIDINDFLEESEFKDGFVVDNHEVRVKINENSEKLVIGSGETAPVLTVDKDGVKVNNIQNAINYAVNELSAELKEAIEAEAATRESADTIINEAIEALENKLGKVSVEKGTSVENYVKLDVSNNGEGATAVTIDDAELKEIIDFIHDDITTEIAAREEAVEELLGTSASTSAETSIWGVKYYVDEIVNNLDADAVQDVEFAAVAEKDNTAYGSNAGAIVVPMGEGEVGKKLVLDLSVLKLDCGEY